MSLVAYVTTADGKEQPGFYFTAGGLTVGPTGELNLISDRSNYGHPVEGTIYAPGTWKEVSFNSED